MPQTVESCQKLTIKAFIHCGVLEREQESVIAGKSGNKYLFHIRVRPDFLLFDSGSCSIGYFFQGHWIEYKVEFVSIHSNLGRGRIWYFVCPFTGNLCRNLYKPPNGKYWAHRSYYKLFYKQQLRTKLEILGEAIFGPDTTGDKYFSSLHNPGKYRKTRYKGKPTRWIQSLKKQYKKSVERQTKYAPVFIEKFGMRR